MDGKQFVMSFTQGVVICVPQGGGVSENGEISTT